jgi:signal transduction histidine kinase
VTRLLLITDDSSQPLIAALSSAADFQVTLRTKFADARRALLAGAFEACLFLPKDLSRDTLGEITATRALINHLPLITVLPIGTATDQQQRVLAAGADIALFHPLNADAVTSILQRLGTRTAADIPPSSSSPAQPYNPKAAAMSTALEVLRDFSQVLGYSLDYRQLTQHFILRLREVVGVSRIAIFLEPGTIDAIPTAAPIDNSRLSCVAAVGVPAELVECFALSRNAGLGRQLTLRPQILRTAGNPAAALDPKILREMEVLGGQVAIPINDRERTLGVAVLGGRLMGGEFTDEELLLVYHLLEELGLAVKNSWLHNQLVGNHRLFASVLDGITIGALVAGPDLSVLYANRAIVGFLRGEKEGTVDFHDLPQAVAHKLHEVVEKGATVEPFFHETPSASVFRVSVIPLRQATGKLPQTALLLLEDFTRLSAIQRAEIESSNLKLIGVIARRFAHEIRNSLVPLTTHQQLFDAEINNADFRDSLKSALTRETQRIQRFTEQMLLLARSDTPPSELAPLDDLLRQSFAKSREFAGGSGVLDLRSDLPPIVLRCNRTSLAHAFQEIFLNGLQSSHGDPRLAVSVNAAATADGKAELVIEVRDTGGGFAPEAAGRATEPFYTTRNTGVGLGLTIARRVIEAHQGRLDVLSRHAPSDPDIIIHLPIPR